LDRLAVGFANGCFGKSFDYLIDPSWKAQVHPTQLIAAEKDAIIANGIAKARRAELHGSLSMVLKARNIFQSCKPHYPKNHYHYVVVPLSKLVDKLRTESARQQLKLTERELVYVIAALDSNSLPPLQSVRRLTALTPAKCFEEHFESFMNLSDEVSNNDKRLSQEASDLTISIESPRTLHTKEVSNSSLTSFPSAKEKIVDIVSQVNPMGLFMKKSPDETDISFSVFLQALQIVYRDKLLVHSRRRSAISVRKLYKANEELSEYLS
jgi:hypothetical protein